MIRDRQKVSNFKMNLRGNKYRNKWLRECVTTSDTLESLSYSITLNKATFGTLEKIPD